VKARPIFPSRQRATGWRLVSVEGPKGAVLGLYEVLQVGFKYLHGFGKALPPRDPGR
jgi:hypothetical protein